MLAVPVGDGACLHHLNTHRKQDQQLFDPGVVGERELSDAQQVVHQHGQARLQPVDQLTRLVGGLSTLLQQARHRLVVRPDLPGEVRHVTRPRLDGVGGLGLRVQHRLGLVDQRHQGVEVLAGIDRQLR